MEQLISTILNILRIKYVHQLNLIHLTLSVFIWRKSEKRKRKVYFRKKVNEIAQTTSLRFKTKLNGYKFFMHLLGEIRNGYLFFLVRHRFSPCIITQTQRPHRHCRFGKQTNKQKKRKMSTNLSPNWPNINVPSDSPILCKKKEFVWYRSFEHTQSSWLTIVDSYHCLSNTCLSHSVWNGKNK